MEILEFKYFSTNDPYDVKWEAWSRVYEYPFVIKWLQTIKLENHGEEWDYPRIHNTGCWWGAIHLQFAEGLEKFWNLTSSDTDGRRDWGLPNNYKTYDILKQCGFQSEIVLCISTLEHLSDQVLAIQNLLDATKDWWYLIITLDCPPIDLVKIEDFLWVKCEDVEDRLDTKNWVIPSIFENINVIKLVIKK